MTLTERKRLAAMVRVQSIGIEMFERHGFDAVSVRDIAEAAQVAERTVYRYFATKERIVLWNPHDDEFLATVAAALGTMSLRDALRAAVARIDDADADADAQTGLSGRQMTLILATPQLRARWADEVASAAGALAVMLARARGRADDDQQSTVDATIAVTAMARTLSAWHVTNSSVPLRVALERTLDAIETWPER